MKKRFTSKEETEKTYSLLEEIPRLEGNPYLFTRIKSKLEEPPARAFTPIWKTATFNVAFSLLLMALNFVSINKFLKGSNTPTSNNLEQLVKDYSLDASFTGLDVYYPDKK